jgi:hypothetical protein
LRIASARLASASPTERLGVIARDDPLQEDHGRHEDRHGVAERELQAGGRVVVQEMAPVDMPLEDRADRAVQLSPHTWSLGRSSSMLARGFDDLDFAGALMSQ